MKQAKLGGLVLLVATLPVFAVGAPDARAASAAQTVAGTSLGVLAIVATPATVFAGGLQPGSTATTTGALTVTDTDPSWALSVSDSSSGTPGHMVASLGGCTGSEPSLLNPLQVEVSSLLGGAKSAGVVSISGSPQTVSSASNQLLAANVFTANYSQMIGAAEPLLTGCIYSLTATYTLQ